MESPGAQIHVHGMGLDVLEALADAYWKWIGVCWGMVSVSLGWVEVSQDCMYVFG